MSFEPASQRPRVQVSGHYTGLPRETPRRSRRLSACRSRIILPPRSPPGRPGFPSHNLLYFKEIEKTPRSDSLPYTTSVIGFSCTTYTSLQYSSDASSIQPSLDDPPFVPRDRIDRVVVLLRAGPNLRDVEGQFHGFSRYSRDHFSSAELRADLLRA